MAYPVKVVGTGPGHRKYISLLALDVIAEAEVLVGGSRLLETYALPGQVQYIIDRDLPGAVAFIRERSKQQKVAVLVSGDTGIYSFANYLRKNLAAGELEFIPGISSVQLMFARLKLPWQEARIISAHGRLPLDWLQTVRDNRLIVLLTGHPYTPCVISRQLLDSGLSDCKVALGMNLSYAEEQTMLTSLKDIVNLTQDYNNCIMVIFNE